MDAPCHCDGELRARAPGDLLDVVERHVPPQRIRLDNMRHKSHILSHMTHRTLHNIHTHALDCTCKEVHIYLHDIVPAAA